jgi:hypothetical protein
LDKETDRVSDLLGQLSHLGYHQFQIERIIRDSVGASDLESLSSEQAGRLVGVLEEYTRFAAKCRSVMKA